MSEAAKLWVGSDHAGYDLKQWLQQKQVQGLESEWIWKDMGCHGPDAVDYPPIARLVCEALLAQGPSGGLGILICGSGNGMCMVANRHPGIRAALCWTPELVALARSHNNANVLCLPARFVSLELALQMVQTFVATPFEGGRHQRRVALIEAAQQSRSVTPTAPN